MQAFTPHFRARAVALLLAFAFAGAAHAEAPLRVAYPQSESTQDPRQAYPKAVLEMALRHSGQPFELQASSVPANQKRALRMLASGDGLDVVWTVATDARAHELRDIPFAIDRGLMGWRVLMVRRGRQPEFAMVHDLAGLAAFHGAQGHDWPDLTILRKAGLDVDGVPTYEGLFAMLARGRVDYAPRSVLEAGDELARRPRQGLALEPALLLRYPAALHFYVNPKNIALADALERGLARAEADGSLDRLFHATYDDVLASLKLSTRTTLELPNPLWSGTPENPR